MHISRRARRAVVCPAEACLERAGDGERHEGALLVSIAMVSISMAVVCISVTIVSRGGYDGALLVSMAIISMAIVSIGARSFHVSIHTKMSSAPMQRIKKRPSSSKVAMRDWPHLVRGRVGVGVGLGLGLGRGRGRGLGLWGRTASMRTWREGSRRRSRRGLRGWAVGSHGRCR